MDASFFVNFADHKMSIHPSIHSSIHSQDEWLSVELGVQLHHSFLHPPVGLLHLVRKMIMIMMVMMTMITMMIMMIMMIMMSINTTILPCFF